MKPKTPANNPPAKPKVRNYKPEMAPSRKLEQNGEVSGVFQTVKQVAITDQNAKPGEQKTKDVMVYTFRDLETGAKFAVLGRAQLDMAFEEVFEQEGGVDRCQGLNMKIVRGADSQLDRGRTMGNYEIEVWED